MEASRLKVLLEVLTEGTQRALRLRVDGRSATKGPVPSWLKAAASFDFAGIVEGSTVLRLEAEPLCRVAPERFGQGELFSGLDASRSGLDLFTESLGEVVAERTDSDLYDSDLVETCARLGGVLVDSGDSLEIVGEGRLAVGREEIGRMHRLRRRTPLPQRVRLSGTLDSIRHSDRMFTLLMEGGQRLRGVAGEVPPDRLASLFGQTALVSGIAEFRPSGSVLRIEADSILPVTGDTRVWSRIPVPTGSPGPIQSPVRPQGPRSGINAVIGMWPGEENDGEIRDLLAKLS